ncbi:hypothetical protein CNMCM6936_007781 [Aspergillus lentulus]|uniref:Potassium channel domain-containing protein n=1 Tax=Aspergillus lentulus TaxID=293939 RepID=A0AAN5YNM2_ASPLE|nr:hypothetical protein CNMCM6936_007781 [Aspergillus lentulus]KAF4204134.1 hypothetical protein CNMCM8927_007840 [Aspergillus lentulus]
MAPQINRKSGASVHSQVPQSSDHRRRQSFWEWLLGQFHLRPPDDDEPQDWWFASTAVPLVAAATGPLANVMSIVALVMPWRSHIFFDQKDSLGNPLQVGFSDPRWCIALNATSLASGLLGNAFLLCNFTRIIRYIIALPASIICWTASMALLVAATVALHVFASPIAPNELYSQAYWSAVIAAILYFILSVILIINMLGYILGHYPQYFALTDGQRTLILQTLSFVIWLLIGAVIFSRVIDISFADALYFSDVTILTVGFGDIAPTNAIGRGILFPYAVMGIIMLGLVVGSIHQFAKDLQYDNVIRKHIERKRVATIRRATTLENNRSGPAENGTHTSDSDETAQIGYRPRYSREHPIRSSISSWTQGLVGRSKLMLMKEEKDRFDAMRAIQNETIIFRRTYNLLMSIAIFGIVWTCGAVVFWQLEEDLSYFDALYFGFCSLITVGYGDFTPTTNAAKPFFVVWSLIAVPTMTTLISEMSDTIVAWFKNATDKVADWTVLPQSSKYKAFLQRLPVIYSALERGAEKKRVAQGFPVGDLEPGQQQDDGGESSRRPRPLEDLARDSSPSRQDLAQQLAFAIRRTAKHALASRPKHYSYEEWVEFTRLIRFTDNSPEGVVLDEDEFGVLNWDWIGETSPMLASQTEPEWILDRLCESLIRYVDGQSRRQPSDQDEKPLSITNCDRDVEEPTLKKERDIRFEDD